MSSGTPAGAPDPGRIKGAAFREFVAWWQRTRGDAALEAAHQRLPAELATGLDPGRPALGILASTWYPALVPHAIVDALTADVPDHALSRVADEGAEAVMGATLKGVYRAAFRLLASPERYPKYVQRIWNMHYDSGDVAMVPTEPNVHDNTFTAWRGHHRFICMLNMASALPIYRAMGCERVTYERLQCVSDGHPSCRSVVRWS